MSRFLLLLLITALSQPAHAQKPVTLRDSDVARLLPMIDASAHEYRQRDAAVSAMLADNDAAERFAADVQAGRVDLEAVLRRHAPHANVPRGARFDAACSRSSVLPGSSGGVRGLFMLAYELPSGDAAADAVAHYRTEGFTISRRAPATTWLAWPDTRADSLVVGVGRTFRPDDGAPGCRHLVGKTVITLTLPSFAITTRADAAAPSVAQATAARARTQAAVAVSPEEFDALIGAAIIARADASNGEPLDELVTLAAQIADMRPMADARRRNVAWYRRHRSALEPALGRFVDRLPK